MIGENKNLHALLRFSNHTAECSEERRMAALNHSHRGCSCGFFDAMNAVAAETAKLRELLAECVTFINEVDVSNGDVVGCKELRQRITALLTTQPAQKGDGQ